ncbi:uncharacterized protein LOC126999451 isoform X2 [Eriocheir sinensis]|uniref:uncharacterized protein LOC126999451 isoform X2 n=1 Tax=Eriocheir sinensis TaxID=95602 RepID=UPI0021CA9864|nr:uncharacterized protein LOC126999451 isoform X2 [Eriocheir sinensis]
MRVPGLVGALCALLLAAGALGGREVDSQRKGLSAPAIDAFLKRITRSCWKELSCRLVQEGEEAVTSYPECECLVTDTHMPPPHTPPSSSPPQEPYLQTVNETTIKVTLNLTRPESYKLICSDDAKDQMCMSQVYVGYEPLEVEDLQCVSHNWESFSCNWTLPYNPVQPANKDYVPYLMPLDDPTRKSLCACNDYDNLLGDGCECPETCCLWGREDYYPVSPQMVVMFVAENDLGSTIFNYTIDNYAVVLPNPMNEVTAAAAAARLEAVVGWTLPAPMTTFAASAAGVLVRVDHRLTDDGAGRTGAWVQGEVVKCRSTSCQTDQQVVQLEHWWRRYEVRVRLRSAAAPQPVEEDGWWSDWQPRYVNTSAAAPDAPPGVGPGTFQAEAAGFAGLSDLCLAWRTVPPLLHNGSDFGYLAQLCAAGDDDELRCEVLREVAVTESFAVFQNVSSSAPYTLRVSAHNSAGGGPWAAVWVAAAGARPAPPLLPVVVQHAGVGRQDALYELRWAPGSEGNHTVYLCTGEHQSARPCTGQLYWVSAGNTSAVNLTLRDFGLQDASPAQISFAVSVEDAADASSGFSWDRCGAPQPYTGVRASPEPGDPVTSSSAVELPWTLSCSFRAGVVEEVEATYCRGAHASPENCTEKPVSTTGQPWAGTVRVSGLAAGEEYTAWLRLHYRGGASAWADGRTFTTNTAGAEEWLIVVVAGVVVLASVILVFGLVYGKRKFVDNLKKLRVKPSLPSGLVPAGRQQEPRGSFNGVGGRGKGGDGRGGVGGGGVPVNQTTVSPSFKNPVYGHTLPTVVGQRPSLSLNGEEMGGDESLGRGVSQGGRPTHQDQLQQAPRSNTNEDLPNTTTTTPEEGTVVSSPSSECLISSPSSPDPLLRKTYAPQYVSPYFSESEGEGRDTPTKPLFPGGYVGLAGPGDSGGGRGQGRGGSQSPPTETWSGSSGGNSGYVPPSACTKLPMSATPASPGYVTAQHGEHVATGSPGYVQSDAIPHPLHTPEGQSGYVSADFPMMVTDAAPPGTIYDPLTTSKDPAASNHDPGDSIPSTASRKGDMDVCEEGKQIEKPSYVSLPDMSWMGDKETAPSTDKLDIEGSESCEKPSYVLMPDMSWMGDKQTTPSTDTLDIEGSEGCEKPRYVTLPDMSWMGDKHTAPSTDKLVIRGSESQKNPPRTASNAPAPGYIAVQPPDFGNHTQKADTEERTGSQDTEPIGHYHDLKSFSDLLSKPSNVLHPFPVHLSTPVFPVTTHDAPGVPCEVPKPGIPHWGRGTSDGYVPLPVTRADDASEKENSSRTNPWINSLISPPRASMTSEEPLTGISFVVLGDNPSRNSSVNAGMEIKETNVNSDDEREGEGVENERDENDRLSIDGLPKGYSRVGNPPQ